MHAPTKLLVILLLSVPATRGVTQATTTSATPPTPPPATKLEAFKPTAGSVMTLAYDELGDVGGVSVDVREMRDAVSHAPPVRGLVVDVTESQYREERSFVDADEISELLKGIDALLEIKTNPTAFENFEVRYTTKGELRITAFNARSEIKYAVEAGRGVKATQHINQDDMRKLRSIFATAQNRLASLPK